MNHKKLLIAIIAIVLVIAVLLVMYFDYRSKHSLSLMGDDALIQYLTKAEAKLTLANFDFSTIRTIIRDLERDPNYLPVEAVNIIWGSYEELRPIVKDYYGIVP